MNKYMKLLVILMMIPGVSMADASLEEKVSQLEGKVEKITLDLENVLKSNRILPQADGAYINSKGELFVYDTAKFYRYATGSFLYLASSDDCADITPKMISASLAYGEDKTLKHTTIHGIGEPGREFIIRKELQCNDAVYLFVLDLTTKTVNVVKKSEVILY